jgi:hypothetical protein
MPDGYYYLPPDKQLGLPLGQWLMSDIEALLGIIPYNAAILYIEEPEYSNITDYSFTRGVGHWVDIHKQPPNLYNPLDHKEEVLMEGNSANEKQPANETKTMELPWQDIGTLFQSIESGQAKGSAIFYKETFTGFSNGYNLETIRDIKDVNPNFIANLKPTHWAIVKLPDPPTVEVPVEPETVSVQDFAKYPVGKWYKLSGQNLFRQFVDNTCNYEELNLKTFEVILESTCIFYATDPTAWLAWKAEQEGESE